MVASLLLLLLASQTPPLPESPLENARIVRHSPRPTFVSGIFHVAVTYEVEAPGGARHLMYQTYLRTDDFIAPPDSRCTIWFWPNTGPSFMHERHDEETGAPHLMIERMRCDTGGSR
ncbi:MAG TPA: hypothetical protein VLK25_12730 [Allosphingosinicella sp.]|nr:hypothetical protein [Allosphingosinicella sp.]